MVTGRLTVLAPPDHCSDTTLRSDIDPNMPEQRDLNVVCTFVRPIYEEPLYIMKYLEVPVVIKSGERRWDESAAVPL
jgi:hypothetical protein